MKNQKGFSLIELLIVVVIIGIIAAIAIPNLLAARKAANEGSAISTMRMLHGANVTFSATVGNGDFAGSTTGATGATDVFTVLHNNRLVDSQVGLAIKSGYAFVGSRIAKSATAPATFFFSAKPITATGVTQTGTRRFGIDTPGVLRGDGTAATTHFEGQADGSLTGGTALGE